MTSLTSRPANPAERARSGVAGGLWLIQAISGLLLVSLLALHMIAHHFIVEGGLRTFDEVIAYVSNPIIFSLEVLFLIVVIVHALLGVRAIVLDLAPRPTTLRVADVSLIVLGVVALIYGLWLAMALQRL
jgi:succinate dehydrogenase hydrophobic anchor subunit